MSSNLILNIGCNVSGVPAFTPEFALRRLGKFFTVLAHEVVDSTTEKTLVARVVASQASLCDESSAIFSLASDLEQQAIAWAFEDAIAVTGTLTGPEAHLWDGGKFNREFFITLDEAKESA